MLTKQRRQEIIREFAVRHNGYFNPKLFFEEVQSTGDEHEAYAWFEWDRDRGWLEHNHWRAREFAIGLQVNFSVEEVGRSKVTVREVSMPFTLSPMDGRNGGGGYIVSDPNDPAHLIELCGQAATDLARWLRRYQAAVIHARGSVQAIEKQLRLLEAVTPQEEAA